MIDKKADLNALVDRAMAMKNHQHMRTVIEKELLHYDILFTLDKENLLDRLTFQGGTSLRLCYNALRFSEDLDFAGGKNFSTAHLMDMKACLEHYIGERYGLEVTVKEPKEMSMEPEYRDIKIDKWQICVTTSPERKDLAKQKIKIEVGNIPAYSREPRALQQNYDFLPDGYSDTLVMVETLNEIMADKLVAFVNCQKYVRHRDIWDLRWLKQQGANINLDFISAKIADYNITNYMQKIDKMIERLDEIIHGKHFYEEMSRFIPLDVQERTLQKTKFLDFLVNEIKILLTEVKTRLP